MRFSRPLLDLVLPMSCVVCNGARGPVCQSCDERLEFAPRLVTRHGLSGIAAVDYSPLAASLISAFKESGRTTLGSGFGSLMRLATEQIAAPTTPNPKTILVPVPSHPESVRGFSPAEVLARNLAPRLGIQWLRGLTMQANVSDQAGLKAESRALNLVGTMTAKPWMSGREVWIVDDLVTTGATIREAARALGEVGCVVTGFVAFAETLRKSDTRLPK